MHLVDLPNYNNFCSWTDTRQYIPLFLVPEVFFNYITGAMQKKCYYLQFTHFNDNDVSLNNVRNKLNQIFMYSENRTFTKFFPKAFQLLFSKGNKCPRSKIFSAGFCQWIHSQNHLVVYFQQTSNESPLEELHTFDIIFSPLILSPFDGRPYRTACADYSPNTPPSTPISFPLQRRPHGNAYGGTSDDPEGARASLGTSSSVLKCTWGDRTQSCTAAVDGRTFAIRRRISLNVERRCFHIILIRKKVFEI